MYLKRTIATVVAVLMIVATANATIVVEVPSGDSGGGGGSSTPLPSTSISTSFDYSGLHGNAYGQNGDDNCYASINFWAEQGVNGKFYEYENSGSNFWTDSYDTRQFTYSLDASFRIVDKENFSPNPGLDIRQNSGINLFGINLNTNTHVENREYWEWEIGADDPIHFITDDPSIYGGFNLSPAHIDSISPDIRIWSWKDDYNYNDTLYINFLIKGHFLGHGGQTAEEIGAAFVQTVPEPATMSILGLGVLGLLRKRNNQ